MAQAEPAEPSSDVKLTTVHEGKSELYGGGSHLDKFVNILFSKAFSC